MCSPPAAGTTVMPRSATAARTLVACPANPSLLSQSKEITDQSPANASGFEIGVDSNDRRRRAWLWRRRSRNRFTPASAASTVSLQIATVVDDFMERLLEAELIDVFASAGFSDVAMTGRFDCSAGTTKERTARRYGVVGVNLCASKSAGSMTSWNGGQKWPNCF